MAARIKFTLIEARDFRAEIEQAVNQTINATLGSTNLSTDEQQGLVSAIVDDLIEQEFVTVQTYTDIEEEIPRRSF